MAAKKAKKPVVDILNCRHCATATGPQVVHKACEVKPLGNRLGDYTHYTTCPKKRRLILLRAGA